MRWKPRSDLLVLIALIGAGAWGFGAPALAACNPAPPPPVCPNDGLKFSTNTDLAWGAAVCGPILSDLIVGDLGIAWATKCIGMSGPVCPVGEDDALGMAAVNAVALPVGRGLWFVARGAALGPDFSWNEPGVGLLHDRDLELVGLCP